MKKLKVKNAILGVLFCTMTMGCVTLQQPLPGSLWGSWAFVKKGTLTKNGNYLLYNYRNVCDRESDRLHFSSDNKMSLRWYDRACVINHIPIGQYHVEDKILNVHLFDNRRYQDRPFLPITKYRIMEITNTTLTLEEIPNGFRGSRDRTKPGREPLVFVLMRLN